MMPQSRWSNEYFQAVGWCKARLLKINNNEWAVMNCMQTLKDTKVVINTKSDIGVKVFVHLCFHSNGGGPPGGGIPVHHHARGDWPAAVLPGPEPDLPVRSTIVEEASQPHEGEDDGKSVCVCVYSTVSVWKCAVLFLVFYIYAFITVHIAQNKVM